MLMVVFVQTTKKKVGWDGACDIDLVVVMALNLYWWLPYRGLAAASK